MNPNQPAVLSRLSEAVVRLESCPEFASLVPEVRTNIAFALPDAKVVADVAAVDGRITVVSNQPKAAGPVAFGASDHLARRILELRRYNPSIRAALNFRWNERTLEFVAGYCAQRGLLLGTVEREAEPPGLVGQDRASMPWKVKRLVDTLGGAVPPVFYETRGWGKEPLFFLIGADPVEIAERTCDIARGFARGQSAAAR